MGLRMKTLGLCMMFLVGCSPSPTPQEIAKRNAVDNFLSDFYGITSVLRAWNCNAPVENVNEVKVIGCEFMLHGGNLRMHKKYCSVERKGGCLW